MTQSDGTQRSTIPGALASMPLAAALARDLFAGDTRQGDMIYRKLGRTGERVSAIGLGGATSAAPPFICACSDRGTQFHFDAAQMP